MLHRFLSYFFKFRHGFSKIDCDGGVHYVVDFCGTNRNLFEVQVSFEPSDPSSVWRIGNKEGRGGGGGEGKGVGVKESLQFYFQYSREVWPFILR